MIKPRFLSGIVNWKPPKTRVPGSTVNWLTVHWSRRSLDSDLLNLVRNNFANWNINLWSGLLRTSTKTRTSASTLGTGKGASKIWDGEKVDVLRSPDSNILHLIDNHAFTNCIIQRPLGLIWFTISNEYLSVYHFSNTASNRLKNSKLSRIGPTRLSL